VWFQRTHVKVGDGVTRNRLKTWQGADNSVT
jgi:hypothetical protein